jgi:hypothetical protein
MSEYLPLYETVADKSSRMAIVHHGLGIALANDCTCPRL